MSGTCLCKLADEDDKVCAVTAAMSLGTGLERFKDHHPERFFDVGIAEEHAVTFASGLAKNGFIPVFAVYSTFLQRCYDQIIHDISLQKIKTVFAIDRAGFVGDDGETHNGLFDVPFLGTIPDITVYSPCSFESLEQDMICALYKEKYSVAVRYPRGGQNDNITKLNTDKFDYFLYGDNKCDNIIVTYGRITSEAIEAVDALSETGIKTYLISLNRIKPIPEDVIDICKCFDNVYFFEEALKSGGIGEKLAFELLSRGYKGNYRLTAVEDKFDGQATIDELLEEYKLSSNAMIKIISEDNIRGR